MAEVLPVLQTNTSDEYNQVRRWQASLLEEPGCKGRTKRFFYYTWKVLFGLEPMWQIIIVSGCATGTQFASTLQRQDTERALVSGLLAGILSGVLLLLLWKASFAYGAFVDPVSAKHFRNEFHPSAFVSYALLLILVALVAWFIYEVDKNCSHLVDAPCDIKHIFIERN